MSPSDKKSVILRWPVRPVDLLLYWKSNIYIYKDCGHGRHTHITCMMYFIEIRSESCIHTFIGWMYISSEFSEYQNFNIFTIYFCMQNVRPQPPLYKTMPLFRTFTPFPPPKNFFDPPLTFNYFVFEYTLNNEKLWLQIFSKW